MYGDLTYGDSLALSKFKDGGQNSVLSKLKECHTAW